MKSFLSPLFCLIFLWLGISSCQIASAQTHQERRASDVVNDFKLQSTHAIDSMKQALSRGIADMQQVLDKVQVTSDGKITTGQETIDVNKQVQKLSDSVQELGKVLDIPAEELRPIQEAVQAMPGLLQQGIELLKNIDFGVLEDKK